MRHQGSEAYNVEAAERRARRQGRATRPSFEVVSGGGLDAEARRGVSPQFVSNVRMALLAAALLVGLGLVRVTLTTATVTLLEENSTLKEQISEAQTLSSDLSIERSVLSSNSRISRIATQNYGMLLPSDHVDITLGGAANETPEEAPASADGEAAQAPEATGEQANMG